METSDLAEQPSREERAWLVVVGASAGGLDALQRFFGRLRLPSNAAFVVVQHLAPDHRSLMSELLGPHCALPVSEAVDGQRLMPDHVYLMPSGVTLSVEDSTLRFEPRPERGLSLPINRLLSSMSAQEAEHAVAVVLSGSGSDGAQGCADLRAKGGFVLVQAPDSAQFDSMPRSVMQTTRPDAVLPPEALADTVLAITQGRAERLADEGLIHAPSARSALQRLFSTLLDRHGVDFGQYKLPTVMRRIERRMQARQVEALSAYADLVEQDEGECEALRQELLIPVTSFFRDTSYFDALGGLLDDLIAQLPEGRSLRLWSAGCASGEEAYSLAILALEACERVGRWPGVKVFGTDVDANILETAAAGTYPASLASAISPERLGRHFTVDDVHMTVRPELRRLVLFTRHNLLEDPPFTRMDVVACRNTLIYLQAQAQERVLRRLQYALRVDGILFMGSSESLGHLQPDFQQVHDAARIHRLQRQALPPLSNFNMPGRLGVIERPTRSDPRHAPDQNRPLMEAARKHILQAHAPLSLLLSPQRVLLHAWGPADRFLRLGDGEPRLDAIGLLPDRLAAVAGHAFHAALHGQDVVEPPLQTEVHGVPMTLRVSARLLKQAPQLPQGVLLTVEDIPPLGQTTSAAASEAPMSEAELHRLGQLESELAETRLSLQTTIEDLEATNEELQATNEELMSANEELQSTNEELQSVNEELYTVNAEFNMKLEALSSLNADLEGMALSTGVATLFVDRNLSLLRFTPEAALVFRLRPSDIGRRFTDFNSPMDYPDFIDDVHTVLRGGLVVEREVAVSPDGLCTVRIVGCGSTQEGQRRAVISLIDISRTRDAQRLQNVMDALSAHVAVLDKHGTILQVNQAWNDFGASNGGMRDVGVGANYLAVLARSNSADALDVLRGLQQVLHGLQDRYQVIYPCHSPSQQRWFAMTATPCKALGGAVVVHTDITAWHAHLAPDAEAAHG